MVISQESYISLIRQLLSKIKVLRKAINVTNNFKCLKFLHGKWVSSYTYLFLKKYMEGLANFFRVQNYRAAVCGFQELVLRHTSLIWYSFRCEHKIFHFAENILWSCQKIYSENQYSRGSE